MNNQRTCDPSLLHTADILFDERPSPNPLLVCGLTDSEEERVSPFSELFPKEILFNCSLNGEFSEAAIYSEADAMPLTSALQSSSHSSLTSREKAGNGQSWTAPRVAVDVPKFPCSMCSFRTDDRRKLMIHRRLHWGEKSFPCTECSAKFTRLYYLKRHLRAKHSAAQSLAANRPGIATVRCCSYPGCSYVSRNQRAITMHRKSHAAKPYYCKQCNLQFSQRRSIVHHLAKDHSSNDMTLLGKTPPAEETSIVSDQQASNRLVLIKSEPDPTGSVQQSARIGALSNGHLGSMIPSSSNGHATTNSSHFSSPEKIGENDQVGTSEYKCDYCSYSCSSFKAVYSHRISKHPQFTKKKDVGTKISCMHCSKKFATIDKLLTHTKKEHLPKVAKPRSKRVKPAKALPSVALDEERESSVQSPNYAPKGVFRCEECAFVSNIASSIEIHCAQVHSAANVASNFATLASASNNASSPLSGSAAVTMAALSSMVCTSLFTHTCSNLQQIASTSSNRLKFESPQLAFASVKKESCSVSGGVQFALIPVPSTSAHIPNGLAATPLTRTPPYVLQSSSAWKEQETAANACSSNGANGATDCQAFFSANELPANLSRAAAGNFSFAVKSDPAQNGFHFPNKLLFGDSVTCTSESPVTSDLYAVLDLVQRANFNLVQLNRKQGSQLHELRTNVVRLLSALFGEGFIQDQTFDLDRVDAIVKETLHHLASNKSA